MSAPAGLRQRRAAGGRHRAARYGPASLTADYWWLWTSHLLSSVGDGIRYVALPWCAALLTHDARFVALVGVALAVPWLMLGSAAGALVDRWNRRNVLLAVSLGRAALLSAAGIVIAARHGGLPALVVLAFLLGVLDTFSAAGWAALVPMVVPPAGLTRANSLLASAQVAAGQFVGPPLGGLLCAVAPGLPFLVNGGFALLSVIPICLAHRIPAIRGESEDHRDGRGTSGLRWLRSNRVLRAQADLFTAAQAALGAAEAVMVLYAVEILHLGQIAFTLLFTALAAGSLVGATLAGPLSARIGAGRLLVATTTSTVAGLACLGATSSVVCAFAAVAAIGAGFTAWMVIATSVRQAIVPLELQGRVANASTMLGLGARPFAMLGAGAVATAAGLHAPYLLSAALLAAAGVWALPALRRLPTVR